MRRSRVRSCAVLLALLLIGAEAKPASSPDIAATTILDLQPFRQTTTVDINGPQGRIGRATLIDLDPRIGAWYLLQLRWSDDGVTQSYHLQNVAPGAQGIALDRAGLLLSVAGKQQVRCALWNGGADAAIELARRSALPYAPLCDGALYLRNSVAGTYTRLERVTNFLRDRVWGGDRIVGFVRDTFFKDAFIESSDLAATAAATAAGAPPAAQVQADLATEGVLPADLGLDLLGVSGRLRLGQWYGVRDAAGIYLSAMQPQAAAPVLPSGARSRPLNLDAVEGKALDYLVAFDLAQFDFGFALGTDHPRVGWSERALDGARDNSRPGPDGIDSSAPLVRTGMVSPVQMQSAAASFTGGFKREHGAFHYGELALRNAGSHYGFIEEGVVFSRLQPALSTLYVLADGTVDMKTWSRGDEPLLKQIRYARQNGVPLVEYDAVSDASAPGPLVNQWGPGNWSGSKDEKLRTLRAGVCLRQTATQRFLIYGYFSSATPAAMARVFLAYGCRYAMHLDMNALEHTYMAVYVRKTNQMVVEHLIQGMAEVDKKGGDQLAPRFLGFPDDRDFFYLLRRGKKP